MVGRLGFWRPYGKEFDAPLVVLICPGIGGHNICFNVGQVVTRSQFLDEGSSFPINEYN